MADIIRNKEYRVFSKSACAQFKLRKIKDDLGGGKSIENYWLFVDAANSKGTGDKTFDWENKVTVRLGLTDVATLLLGFRNSFKGEKKTELYHDPGKGSNTEGQEVKVMGIVPGEKYGHMLYFRYTKKAKGTDPEKKINVTVSLTDEQMIILKLLFERSVIMLTGFYDE
jgi:hypothetical protein